MEDGFEVFVEYLRSIFHEQIALFLTLSLFLVIIGAIAFSFAAYFAFFHIAFLLGYNVRHSGAVGDLHNLEEAHATRQLKTMAKLPCSQACYCRLLPQQSPLPVTLIKTENPSPNQIAEKKLRESTYEMMFTIISSSSSSSFGSGKSDSLDHSASVNGSPSPSYRSKVFSPPGLSPNWKRALDSTHLKSPIVPSSPAPSYRSRLHVVETPPAARIRRDVRRESWNELRPASLTVQVDNSSRKRSASFV
ncbi:hypothetical protein SCHPADRAFT_47997 [Schizopora paradoxa]|uniref:Uncharacterized protein n=1 Tax=Schizopora paradoxa TaxID=27342 RepID=A0A0H2S6Q7_9AGAM|nr:hypothetical protein SCHPADRAFT_47997 [Schizopora paradoxa]